MCKQYSENIDENEMIYSDHGNVHNSYTAYIVLFVIAFLIIIGISNAFIHFHWFLKKSNTNITNINHYTETIIY